MCATLPQHIHQLTQPTTICRTPCTISTLPSYSQYSPLHHPLKVACCAAAPKHTTADADRNNNLNILKAVGNLNILGCNCSRWQWPPACYTPSHTPPAWYQPVCEVYMRWPSGALVGLTVSTADLVPAAVLSTPRLVLSAALSMACSRSSAPPAARAEASLATRLAGPGTRREAVQRNQTLRTEINRSNV